MKLNLHSKLRTLIYGLNTREPFITLKRNVKRLRRTLGAGLNYAVNNSQSTNKNKNN